MGRVFATHPTEKGPMARHIAVALTQRDTFCTAVLLDDLAPRTCAAVWGALPIEGDVSHATYARHEVYTLVPPFASEEPGTENPTITPIPGDLCYFTFPTRSFPPEFRRAQGLENQEVVVDLALFYGRNNLLLNADVGFVPGNVFASVIDGFDDMAAACHDIWQAGSVGERLRFTRV